MIFKIDLILFWSVSDTTIPTYTYQMELNSKDNIIEAKNQN